MKRLVLLCVVGLLSGCEARTGRDGGVRPTVADGAADTGIGPRIQITDCVQYLDGDGAMRCASPTDDLFVDFGALRLGQCRTATLTVENTGDSPLWVGGPTWAPGSSEAFELLGGAPSTPFELAPGPGSTKTYSIRFCEPGRTQRDQARLVFTSNDPAAPELPVDLYVAHEACSAPVCACPPATVEVAPGDTLQLRANCSTCDSGPVYYHWSIESRPPDSHAVVLNPDSANASVVVDVQSSASAPYVFRVTQTDSWGASGSCTITAFAVPRDALHIQLTWDQSWADLDLHLLNPLGTQDPYGRRGYFNTPNDCQFSNRTPDWGVPGQTIDNPRLNLDDTFGYGPENLNLNRPQPGRYRVGAHNYCNDGSRPLQATVRVFCNGQLTRELGPRLMDGSGAFWDVAEIVWPGCEVVPIDRMLEAPQGCGREGSTWREDGGVVTSGDAGVWPTSDGGVIDVDAGAVDVDAGIASDGGP